MSRDSRYVPFIMNLICLLSFDLFQVSCLWQGEHLLTVGLSGFISYLDKNNPSKPLRVLKGHNKPITAMAVSEDKKKIYTGSHDGFVTR